MSDVDSTGTPDQSTPSGGAEKSAGAKRSPALKPADQTGNEPQTDDAEAEETGRLRAALNTIQSQAEELRRWGSDRGEQARAIVEDRPLAVVGSAFAVGLLLGLAASRL